MAWPLDAIIRTFSPNQPVPSDDLNEIQGRIVDLHRLHEVIISDLITRFDSSGLPIWERPSTPEYGWERTSRTLAAPTAFFDVPLRGNISGSSCGAILRALRVKYFNAHISTALPPPLSIYLVDCKFDADSTAPALGSALAQFTTPTHDIPVTSWGVRSLTGLSITVTEHHRLMIYISDGNTSDRVAAVKLELEPLTPTP